MTTHHTKLSGQKLRNGLITGSLLIQEKLVYTIGMGITLIENSLKIQRSGEVKQTATNMLNEKLDFSYIICSEHFDIVKNSLVEGLIRIAMKWYCTRLVPDLKLKRSDKQKSRKVRMLQHQ